jgi:opacity protein-like surface antigen
MKTIKLGLISLSILLFSQVLNAQNNSSKLSFRAGLNSAQLDFGGFKVDPIIGVNIGASYELLNLSDKIILRPEIMFSQQGFSILTDAIGNNSYIKVNQKTNLNYLTLPVNLDFQIDKKFSIVAGPYIGLLLNKNSLKDIDLQDDDSKSTDFGFNAGINYAITNRIKVDVRYLAGSNILKTTGDFIELEANNKVWQFGIILKP